MRRAMVVVGAAALLLAACGSDDDDSKGSEPLQVTLSDQGVEGLPSKVEAGLVKVTVSDKTEGAGGELNFSRVKDGTKADSFPDDIAPVLSGGPFPDYFLDNAGIVDSGTITLKKGDYIVWTDLATNLDRDSTADDVKTAVLTVEGGDDDASLPDADGTIKASDYKFDVDVKAGPSTLNFVNDSEKQLHHAILVDFGDQDPDVIRKNLPALLESEDDAPPPADIDVSKVNFDFGSSGVFGPGSSGTFQADFKEGNTYAVLCFLSDRDGGPPHAIKYQMYDVFKV